MKRKKFCRYQTGLRIHCADRVKTVIMGMLLNPKRIDQMVNERKEKWWTEEAACLRTEGKS